MYKFRSGLYDARPTLSHLLEEDPTALDGIQLPQTVSIADFKVAAVAQLGDLDTLFHNAAQLSAYLPVWSAWHLPQWQRIEDALAAEYDPIYNYSMHEVERPAEYTETTTPAETTNTVRPPETRDTETPAEITTTTKPAEITKTTTPAETTDTERPAETTDTERPAETTDTERPAETTSTGARDNGIYGFNSAADAVPSDTSTGSSVNTTQTPGTVVKTTQTAGTVVKTTQTAGTVVKTTQTPETEATEVNRAATEKVEVDTSGRVERTVQTAGTEVRTTQSPESREFQVDTARDLVREGNVGVTTSQQMLESEVQLRLRWNMMQIILDAFREDICVGVW